MNVFTYQYWDENGAVRSDTLRAANRAEALRQIRDAGRSVITLTEGKASVPGRRALWNPVVWNRAAWIGVAGVVLVAALSVWLTANKKPAKRPAPEAAKVETSPAGTPPRGVRGGFGETALPASRPTVETPATGAPPRPQPPVADAAVSRNANLRPLHPPPEETEEEEVKPSRRFTNISEGLLAMALSVPPGAPVPPLPIPPNIETEFAKALTNDIVLYEDDDERTVELKENIAAAKEQMREMVKQGQSVAEILTEYQNRANEEAALRRQAQLELNKLFRSGAVEEAQAYHDEVNQIFSELGITPIDLHRNRRRSAP